MPAFLGVPVVAAYHVVSVLAGILTPLLSGLAAAAAIVLFTMGVRLLLLPLSYRAMRGMDAQARLAPRVQALQKEHAGHPDRLQRELSALYRAEGTSMLGGCLPLLAQWPFLSVMYLLFRSPVVGGTPNTLLTRDLLRVPLGAHWLGAVGPVSAQGAVFLGVFALLAALCWLSARLSRVLTAQAGATAAVPAGGAGLLLKALPYLTVVIAAFAPLAAGIYLVTSLAWSLAERMLYRRKAGALAAPAAVPAAGGSLRSRRDQRAQQPDRR